MALRLFFTLGHPNSTGDCNSGVKTRDDLETHTVTQKPHEPLEGQRRILMARPREDARPLPLSNLSQRRAALISLAAAARARAHGCGLGCFCCLEVGINRQPHNEGPSDALSSSNCSPLKRKCTPRCLLKKTTQLGK